MGVPSLTIQPDGSDESRIRYSCVVRRNHINSRPLAARRIARSLDICRGY